MAFRGSLAGAALVDVLQLIAHQGRSGTLWVYSRGRKLQLRISNGAVVGVEAEGRPESERLLNRLVRAKLMTPKDRLSLLETKRQDTGFEPMGLILTREGIVDAERLKHVLWVQLRDSVLEVFLWDEGYFEFKRQAVGRLAFGPPPSRIDHLVMDGVGLRHEWPEIEKALPDIKAPFVLDKALPPPPATGDFGFESFDAPQEGADLDESDREIAKLIGRRSTLSALYDMAELDRFQLARGVVRLLERGYLRLLSDEELATAVEVDDDEHFDEDGLDYAVHPHVEPEARSSGGPALPPPLPPGAMSPSGPVSRPRPPIDPPAPPKSAIQPIAVPSDVPMSPSGPISRPRPPIDPPALPPTASSQKPGSVPTRSDPTVPRPPPAAPPPSPSPSASATPAPAPRRAPAPPPPAPPPAPSAQSSRTPAPPPPPPAPPSRSPGPSKSVPPPPPPPPLPPGIRASMAPPPPPTDEEAFAAAPRTTVQTPLFADDEPPPASSSTPRAAGTGEIGLGGAAPVEAFQVKTTPGMTGEYPTGPWALGTTTSAHRIKDDLPVCIQHVGEEFLTASFNSAFDQMTWRFASLPARDAVRLLDTHREPSHAYIVLEQCDRKAIEPPLEGALLLSLARAGARALGMLHDLGIYHGRLSPKSFATREGRPVLVDAHEAVLTETASALRGDWWRYAAPERLLGGAPTPLSDIFSFGATLYALLTGDPPFPQALGREPLAKLITEQPIRLEVPAPEHLKKLILDCLQPEPKRRPSNMHRLNAILSEAKKP